MYNRNMAITVAFVTHSAQCSGAELFVARTCAALDRVHPVVVLGEHGPVESVLRARGIEYVVIPLGASVARVSARGAGVANAATAAVGTIAATVRLRNWLRSRGVDVVATHSAKAHVYAGAAARAAGVPVVAHAHDIVGVEGSAPLGARLLRAVFRTVPREVIANSRTTLGSLPAAARRRATVIGCPADVGTATPQRDEVRRFVLVGRITAWKGQDIAVRALAAARACGLDRRVRLTLVGAPLFDGDLVHEHALRTLVDRLGLTDAIEFRGHVDDVAAEYARADAVLHTSRRPEPFGQVVVEALAAGRPVIAADTGGPAEILTHEHDGLLVPSDDPAALAAAMLRIADDAALRASLVTEGRSTALAHTPERIATQIEDVLLRAVAR